VARLRLAWPRLAFTLCASPEALRALGTRQDGSDPPSGGSSGVGSACRGAGRGTMTTVRPSHRLDGLEPDNLLAFLALLGVMRALEADDATRSEDDRTMPRAGWDIDQPPLRPRLFLASDLDPEGLAVRVASGVRVLAAVHVFGGRKDLNHSR